MSWVLLLKMPNGNFFNWLLFNRLPKEIEKGIDYFVLAQEPIFFSVSHEETWGSNTNYDLAQN